MTLTYKAAVALALSLLPVSTRIQAQNTILEVRAEVTPSLTPFRELDDTPSGVVSVSVADSPARYGCRLVLRDGVLCRIAGVPRNITDLQLIIEAPGYRRTIRTASRVLAEQSRLVARLDRIHLQPASVTAAPLVVSFSDSTVRFQMSVTNRSAERIDIRSIVLDAMRPTGTCMAGEPTVVYHLSTTLVVQENSASRWAVAASAREPGHGAEHLRVTGELTKNPCFHERLVLRLAPRMSIAGEDLQTIDLVLPARFSVEGRNAGGSGFDGSVGAFSLYVVAFQTSSASSPDVRTFVRL